MFDRKRIRPLLATIVCILFLTQCERNSLYFYSADALSFLGLDALFSSSQINVEAGRINFLDSGTYDFGTVTVGYSSPAVVFTLRNTGADTLTLTGAPVVAISGDNAADFTASVPAVTILSPGVSTTFTATFTPGLSGNRVAVADITYVVNGKESTYRINLTGTGSAAAVPDINVNVGGSDYFSGSTYSFGSVVTGYSSMPVTFSIQNVGAGTLYLSTLPNVTISGANASDFTVSDPGVASIITSGTETFTIIFTPASVGVSSAVITIQSDDPDSEGTYTIILNGTGVAPTPDINVQVASVNYANGNTYDFGEQIIGGTVTTQTFTIQNLGTAALTINSLSYGGAASGELTGSGPSTPYSIAAGADNTFTLGFDPKNEGSRTAYITISSDDPDVPAYVINLTVTAVMPIMVVHGGGTSATSLYDPITNTFTASTSITGSAGAGAHTFQVPTGSSVYPQRILLHGNSLTDFSWYDPSLTSFTLDSTPLPYAIGAGAHSFNMTTAPYGGYVMTVCGGSSTNTIQFNYLTNSFEDHAIPLDVTAEPTDTAGAGSLLLPITGGDLFVLFGNIDEHGTIFNQATNVFSSPIAFVPGSNVRNGAHAFSITSGVNSGYMLFVPVGGTNGDEMYLYNPTGPIFTVYSEVLTDTTTGAGGHSIPITSGTNAGRALIIHGGTMGNNTTSVYNTDGTITTGPTFTDGPIGVGAFSFAITGGPYKGMYMIVHGNGGDVVTIFDPNTLTFVGTVYLSSYAGAGAHCFPAK